eukprot:3940927-Rhodomonas_salina.6
MSVSGRAKQTQAHVASREPALILFRMSEAGWAAARLRLAPETDETETGTAASCSHRTALLQCQSGTVLEANGDSNRGLGSRG